MKPSKFRAVAKPSSTSRLLCMALLPILLVFAGCRHPPAEQQIRAAIASATAAARANDVRGVLAIVSDDFTGNDGDFDKRGLHRLLAMRALRQDKSGVLVGPIAFEHKGDRIIARFNLVLTGGKPGDLLPEQSSIRAMTTAWRREDGHWRCYQASWTR